MLSNDWDPDGSLDSGSLRLTSAPSIGTASVVGGAIRFVPLLADLNSTTFTYEVCDHGGLCAQAVVTVLRVL